MMFVYGTLKSMHWNHAHFLAPRKPVCTAVIHGYELRYTGRRDVPDEARRVYDPQFGIPIAVSKEGGEIEGEVYEVDAETLRRIDMLEGVELESGSGTLYNRIEVDVSLEDGGSARVIVYVADSSRLGYGLS